MDFAPGRRAEELREEVRELLAEHLTEEVRERVAATGTFHDWGLHRAIARRGWLSLALPESGDAGSEASEALATLVRELELAHAPSYGTSLTMLLLSILAQVGSELHRREIMAPLLEGEAIVALGYSEPDSGSDVAAAKTRARRGGSGWLIDGQKVFTSLAEEARWIFLLTRTDTEAAKHRGLTFFLVPTDSPGLEIQPVDTLSGERTNITFYEGVQVADEYRVGEVDGGWEVMRVALAFERGVLGNSAHARRLYDRFVRHAAETARGHGRLLDDPLVRDRLVDLAIECEVADLLALRAAWVASQGRLPAIEGATCKLFASEVFASAARWALDVLGPEAVLRGGAERAPGGGVFEEEFRFAPVTTIYGGTSEIQKNLIAQRHLRLPRSG